MSKSADAFRTISEVADELDLHKHVLRFWEVKFPQIKPMKRGGGRRYYRPADLELLRGIRHLLHSEGYTIKGVQRIIREKGIDAVKRASGGDVHSAESATKGEQGVTRPVLAEKLALDGAVPAGGARRGRAAGRGPSRIVEVANDIVARSRMPSQMDRKSADEIEPSAARKLAPAHRQVVAAALTELRACRDLLKGDAAVAAAGVAAGGKTHRISG